MSELTKIFSNHGIICDVLTTEDKYANSLDLSMSHGAFSKYQTKVTLPILNRNSKKIHFRVYKRLYKFVQSKIFLIDNREGWIKHAYTRGKQLLKTYDYNAIIVSGPPFSSFLVADKLCHHFNVPLILDYRDPWTAYNWTYNHSSQAKIAERRIVFGSTAAVFCTSSIKESFLAFFPEYPRENTVAISNGFDQSRLQPSSSRNEEIHIGHAGSFYGRRTLCDLIEPIKLIQKKTNRIVNLHHWGKLPESEYNRFCKAGLQHNLKINNRITRNRLLNHMAKLDMLFAMSGNDVKYALPFKIFDYMSTGVPILGITPEDSELNRFILSNGIGFTAEHEKVDFVVKACLRCLNMKRYISPEKFLWSSIGLSYIDYIRNRIRK